MPFLTLNGVTIPTKAGGEIKITEYGERTGAFDGSAQIDVRARKREWQFTTKPISMVRSRSIEGLVQGLGLYMPYDFTGGAATGIYASNGLYPLTVSSNYGVASYLSADSKPVYDENSVLMVHSGTQSLGADAPSTNLLTAAQASGILAGWTTTGSAATLAQGTSVYFEGSSALSVTFTAGGGAAKAVISSGNATAATAGQWFTVSTFVYAPYGGSLYLGAYDKTGNLAYFNTVNLPSNLTNNFWQRIATSVQVTTATSDLRFFIASSVTRFLTLDGFQLEAAAFSATTSPASTYMAGGTVRPTFDVVYPFNYYNPTGFTVSAWVVGNLGNPSQNCSLFNIFDNTGNRIGYGFFSGSPVNTLTCAISTNSGTYILSPALPAGFTFNAQWNHVVCTYTGAPFTNAAGTTFQNFFIYLNGVLLNSGVAPGAINTPSTAEFGATSGVIPLLGRLDDVQVLPFGVDDKWVAQTYAAAAPLGTVGPIGLTPFLTAAGDGIDGAPVTVHGSVKQANYVGFQDPKFGWISQGRQLQILLVEA